MALAFIIAHLFEMDTVVLPPTKTLAAEASVGVGTMAKALTILQQSRAIKLQAIQRYGTTIEWVDYVKLWTLGKFRPLRGIFPMPLSLSIQALEYTLTKAIEGIGMAMVTSYREGAMRRLSVINDERSADFTIMSDYAANTLQVKHVRYRFGPGSYYGHMGIYKLLPMRQRVIHKVGVDEMSPDHKAMTLAEFPGAEVVSVPFRLLPRQIIRGEVDATVWYGGTAVPVEYINHLRSEPALSKQSVEIAQAAAVLVVNPENPAFKVISLLDVSQMIQEYQEFTS